mgnify:CR=1 FL=1
MEFAAGEYYTAIRDDEALAKYEQEKQAEISKINENIGLSEEEKAE